MRKKDFYWMAAMLCLLLVIMFHEAVVNEKPVAREPELITNPLFKLVVDSKNKKIQALDGKTKLSDFKDSLDDRDNFIGFNGLNKNYEAVPTGKISVEVNQLVMSATPREIFNSKEYKIDKYVMTQSQVVQYCRNNYAQMIKEDTKSLFLLKGVKKNEYFWVLVLCINGHQLDLTVAAINDFRDDCALKGYSNFQVVTPVIEKPVNHLLPEWMYPKYWFS